MKEIIVKINTELLEYYMRKHGADEQSCMDMHKYIEPFEIIDADKLWFLASGVLVAMDTESKDELCNFYGCELRDKSKLLWDYTGEAVGHIADEILDECCRTLFEFN